MIDPTIFRSYDIRGVVGQDLTLEAVERIGRAYATIARERGAKMITVGRDCRESSPALFTALVRGLNGAASPCHVIAYRCGYSRYPSWIPPGW